MKKINSKIHKYVAYLLVLVMFCLPLTCLILGIKFKPLLGKSIDYQKPKFSFKSYLVKNYQKDFENYVNKNLTFNYFEIRLFNTVYYYVFNKTYASQGKIIVGKDRVLIGRLYIDIFLSDLVIPSSKVKTFAKDLKVVQDYLASKDKVFILVITPSKAVFCADKIPDNFLIFKRDNNYLKKYNAIIKELQKQNVNLINEPEELRERKMVPFVKGGIHQSDEGRFLVADLLIQKVNSLSDFQLPNIEVEKIEIDKRANGEDSDYANLLNLFKAPTKYPTPIYVMKKVKPVDKNINFIGGSFCWGIIDILKRTDMFEYITQYSYFISNKFIFKDFNAPIREDAKNHEKNIENILKSDIIVLEINEEVLMRTLGGYRVDLFIKEMKKNIKR